MSNFEGGQSTLVLHLSEYKAQNFRLDGLRKLHSVGATIPSPIYVVPHEAYLLYKQNPETFFQQISKDLEEPAQQTATLSKKEAITLRRAFDIPNLANPTGPRFLGVKPEEMVDRVSKLFKFANENYAVDGANIACFFYPFIDPRNKPLEQVELDDVLPFGGHVVPITSDGLKLQILATWGNNETLFEYEQRGKPIETYNIEVDSKDPTKIRIPRKLIVPKTIMHYTSQEGQSSLVTVPVSHQFGQVMFDSEIVDVARSATLMMRKYGPQRVEFSSDGDQVFLNESIDIEREVQDLEATFTKTGEIFTVSSEEDVKRLIELSDAEANELIIYASDRTRGSSTNSLLAAASKGRSLVILYSGTTRTAHIMKIFSDLGHTAFAVGQQELKHGDYITVKAGKGLVNIENQALSIPEATSLITAFKLGRDNVGGKAERISYLKSLGYDIPQGVVLTTAFFDAILDNFGVKNTLLAALSFQDVQGIGGQIREMVTNIPEHFWQKVKLLMDRYNLLSEDGNMIVRSSANVEDMRGHSFAGIFESIPFLSGEDKIREGVIKCINSAFSPTVINYLGTDNLEKLAGIKLAIIVQEMVDARISGTVFGGDTQTGNKEMVVIEAKAGYGSEIVEGITKEAQSTTFDKRAGKIISRRGLSILTSAEEVMLFQLANILEKEFLYPQDIEWSIDKNNKLWIVQARDF